MSRKGIIIGLALLIVVGVILALTLPGHIQPDDLATPPESENTADSESDDVEVMAVGDFISRLVTEEYEQSMAGTERTIASGTAVRILGRVEDIRVTGEHPYFRGEVNLTPYYCSRRVQCIFWGEDVAQLQELSNDMDVVIEGRYYGIMRIPYAHDIYRLVECSLLSIVTPQTWTVPVDEDVKGDAINAGYLVRIQSEFTKGDPVSIFGRVDSVTIDWSYLEGIWGDVLVTMILTSGTECRFEGEELQKIMQLPEGQEVIIEGEYSYGSASRAFLAKCSLIYP